MRELPQGWAEVCLGELGVWTSGGTPSRRNEAYFGGDIPWVKTGDLHDTIVEDIEETITKSGLHNSSAKLFPAGTLLVAMYGATIGRTGLLNIPAATNQACAAFLPTKENSEVIPYLWWYLRASISKLRELGQGGAQPNISQTLLKKFQIPIPPLNEQRFIVAKLDRLFARTQHARAEAHRSLSLIENLEQATLAKAFQGDLTFDWRDARGLTEEVGTRSKGSGGMRELPQGWASATVGDLAEYLNGAAFKPGDWVSEGTPIIRIQNLTDTSKPFNCTKKQLDKRYLVRKGNILVSWSATLDAFIWQGKDSWLNQHIFKVTPHNGVDPAFLFYLLKREIAALIESEHLHGTTMKHINRGPFLAHEIGLPPSAEQRHIVAKLDSLFARTQYARTETHRSLSLIDHLNQAILSKAFRGELMPQDLNDESASVLLERIYAERATKPKLKRGRRRAAH